MEQKDEIIALEKEYNTDIKTGLTDSQVVTNRNQYGVNELRAKKEKPWYVIFLLAFLGPLPIILILAAVLSVLTSAFIDHHVDFIDFTVILIIVIVNAIISTVEELRARSSVKALKNIIAPKAVVKRNGKVQELDSKDLVVGDILVLEAGKYIPADFRIVECSNLYVDEAPLTGESVPVEKTQRTIAATNILAEKANYGFASTFITNGRAIGIVTAVGQGTEIGKISNRINEIKVEKTPLQSKLNQVSRWITIGAVIIAICIFLLLFFTASDKSVQWSHYLVTAITLAIAIIPESLPIIVSVVLALSSQRMAKKNVIVKNLQAVETLGSVNVICSDKTGTLTQNKMTIQTYFWNNSNFAADDFKYDAKNYHHQLFFNALILCNDGVHTSKQMIGDPTEIALIDWTSKYNIDTKIHRETFQRVDEIPFDSDRKLMSTVNQVGDQELIFVKGAIDQLLVHCTHIMLNGKTEPMTAVLRDKILAAANENSRKALRVLGFAYRHREANTTKDHYEDNLTFLGGVGMIDPPRDSARISIEQAHAAGIRVIMITGDHKTTAFAIAKSLKIAEHEEQVLSGDEVDSLDQAGLVAAVKNVNVFARVSPEHKVRIVEALQSLDLIVSMTGDGVNDAPSLVKANIGVAMGITGTDVAKQAANLILTDDNFASIINGVIEGRNVYQKIKNAICFILASNFAEVLSMLIVVLISHLAPFSAINVLWFNLVVESILAIPIGMNRNDPSLMRNQPRSKRESIFKSMLIPILSLTVFTTATVVGSYYIGLYGFGDGILTEKNPGATLAFFTMINAPIWYCLIIDVKNYRREFTTWKIYANKTLVIAIAAAFVLNLIVVLVPYINTKIFNVVDNLDYRLVLSGIGLMFIPFILEYGWQNLRRAVKF